MNLFVQRGTGLSRVGLFIWILLLLGGATVGCGPNQEDLMLRAAQRSRGDDEEVTAPPVSAVAPADSATAAATAAVVAGDATAAVTQQAAPAAERPAAEPGPAAQPPTAKVADANLQSIAQRRPPEPLDEFTRRSRAAENLKQIGTALKAYIDKQGYVPLPAVKSASGIELLSWRVELLPYLGHADLYAKFDLTAPWDSPANLPLLELIPDCYVSPDRFDSKTNYLGAAGSGCLFNGRYVTRSEVEDGLDNTLIVVEVDDSFAVPWTSPQDYQVDYQRPAAGLGQLRPDGTYALWANGWTTLLRKDVGDRLLLNAFTYESGDAQLAGVIHQPLRIDAVAPNAVSAMASDPADAVVPIDEDRLRHHAEQPATRRDGGHLPRMSLPGPDQIQQASEAVRSLYRDRFKATRQPTERSVLAEEMLQTASLMREDAAGAYAMQQVVMDVATSIGDIRLLVSAVDHRVAMFEVDAVAENTAALAKFAEANAAQQAMGASHGALLRRALPVIDQSVRRDEYTAAIELASYLLAVQRQAKMRPSDSEILQLRTQLKVASDYLTKATDAIATLRRDESNAAALGAVGRYTAFIKGDWEQGLAMLRAGDNEQLAALAAADATAAGDPERMLVVADQWWDLGQATANKVFRGGCHERAGHWYQAAYEMLSESLAKLHAKARIEASKSVVLGSPLAIITRIAKASGIDLPREVESLQTPLLVLAARYPASE